MYIQPLLLGDIDSLLVIAGQEIKLRHHIKLLFRQTSFKRALKRIVESSNNIQLLRHDISLFKAIKSSNVNEVAQILYEYLEGNFNQLHFFYDVVEEMSQIKSKIPQKLLETKKMKDGRRKKEKNNQDLELYTKYEFMINDLGLTQTLGEKYFNLGNEKFEKSKIGPFISWIRNNYIEELRDYYNAHFNNEEEKAEATRFITTFARNMILDYCD